MATNARIVNSITITFSNGYNLYVKGNRWAKEEITCTCVNLEDADGKPIYGWELHDHEDDDNETIESLIKNAFDEFTQMFPHLTHLTFQKSGWEKDFPYITRLYDMAIKHIEIFNHTPGEEEPFFALVVQEPNRVPEAWSWYRTSEERNQDAKDTGFEVNLGNQDNMVLGGQLGYEYNYNKGFHGARNRRW